MSRRPRPPKASRPASAATPAPSRTSHTQSPAGLRPKRLGTRVVVGLAIVAAAIAVAIAGRLLVPRAGAARNGPIVLISIDTLRADHLPAYGYHGVETPNIDRLVADSVLFDRAYAHVPQTLPSHVSILSGELPFEHGVRDNIGFTVKPGQRMLPEILREHGYHTGGFASSFILRKETGFGRGFDVYDADTPPLSPNSTFGTVRRDGAQTLDRAEQWLARQSSDRFFLFVHFYEPHRPYRPPARYSHYPNPYDGTIAYSDELVGRLIADLKQRGAYDNATIVLLSDHGEGLGDHGEQEHGVFLYDSTIHVPLIVKLPGQRDAGTRVTSPVAHIDLVPTLLDLAHIRIPRDLRGHSLRAAMDGSDRLLADRGVYSETLYPLYHFGWSPLYALTDPRYRYIMAPRPELYDLQRDKGQLHNLQGERQQTAGSMQSALDVLVSGRPVDRPSATSGADIERFQALGYIGSARMPVALEKRSLPDPKDKTALLDEYRKGIDLRSEGKFSEAATAFRHVLDDSPTMVDVWAQLSQVLAAQGMKREAADAMKRAVDLDPQNPDNQILLASAEFESGQLADAASHARLAAGARPGPAHELLARIAFAGGREADGLAEARLASEADPSQAFSLYVQGAAYAKAGKYTDALPLFERALAATKAHRTEMQDLHLATADTLAHLDRAAEAESEFKAELAAFPQNGRARVGLAMLYRAQGRVREANDTLVEIVRAAPTPANYVMAARTLQVLGEPDAARDLVVQGLRRFPRDPQLRAFR